MKGTLLENDIQDMRLDVALDQQAPAAPFVEQGKWLLCIGPNSKEVGEQMKAYHYKTLKFSMFDKAMQWLNACVMKQIPMPDAIICDTKLSGEDLFKNVSRMKRNPDMQPSAVIFVSSAYDEEEKRQAILSGADDYYSRPMLNFEDLDFRIKFIKEFMKVEDQGARHGEAIPEVKPRINSSLTKRAFDIIVSLGILLVASPVLLVIAILIKLDSKGPVFYISKRAGTGYKIFDFYKFRTMKTGADAELAQLAALNKYDNASETEKNDSPVFFKLEKDPRVTRLGHFLRKTSIDELPQLINVLKGDMSLVGNRPLPLYEAEMLTKDEWAMRFLAPAGITGLWQITKKEKRNMTPEERLALDITYSKNNSFWNDLKILMKTLPAAVQSEEQK